MFTRSIDICELRPKLLFGGIRTSGLVTSAGVSVVTVVVSVESSVTGAVVGEVTIEDASIVVSDVIFEPGMRWGRTVRGGVEVSTMGGDVDERGGGRGSSSSTSLCKGVGGNIKTDKAFGRETLI